LVKTLLGYVWPRYGAVVEILGKRFGRVDLNELRKSISWASPFIEDYLETTGVDTILSGKEGSLGFFRKANEEELLRVKELLVELGALHLANKNMREMSSGERMKILMARALLAKPELMILDEPTAYLDITQREFILKIINNLILKNPNLTVIFISQRIEDILPTFDCGMILKDGKIEFSGSHKEVLCEENLKKAFGVDIKLIETKNGRLWGVVE
jgi:iron complex transport system ATP-binding protein